MKRYNKCNFLIISFLISLSIGAIVYCSYIESKNDITKIKMQWIIDKQHSI